MEPVHKIILKKIKTEMNAIKEELQGIDRMKTCLEKTYFISEKEWYLRERIQRIITLLSVYRDGGIIPIGEICSFEAKLSKYLDFLKKIAPYGGNNFSDLIKTIEDTLYVILKHYTKEIGERFSSFFKNI